LDDEHCEDVQKMAEQKRHQIDEQIKDLTALRNVLDGLVKGCQQDQSTHHCSIIDVLSNRIDPQS
jgi:MerR family mercuric resistance operon transcriptional regulator